MTDYNINFSLICAVHEGNLKKATELINSFGLSYSQAWSKGYVLLRDATEKNHTAIIKLLLTNGSKVNSKASKNNPSNTPLHFAVINGNIEIVKMLIDRGADINAKNEYNKTPLYIAIKKEKIEIIELLLNCGANVNERDYITVFSIAAKRRIIYDKYTLQWFVEKKHEKEMIKLLLTRGANFDGKDQYGRTPLHTATENMKIEITELLLNCGANVNATDDDNITPLHIATQKRAVYELWYYTSTPPLAVEKEHEKVVKMLLDRGANINAKDKYGRTPLYNAIENKEIEIIELLLNHGANVNIKDNDGITPLHIAVEKEYLQIVEHLLKHGAYVNSAYISTSKKGYTPLYLAVEKEHEKLVKLLLECGANVDAQDNDGKTILHFAVEKGQLVIIEHILKYCPDINNKNNRSSLNAAVYHYKKEYSKIVEKLLQYGFTVNPEDVNNCKLLHAAVKKGYLRIVEELLKYGADVNMMLYDSTSGKGYTPLHIATKNKQKEVAKLLISYEADVNAKDETGKTPIFYATENADLKITKLLLSNKANVKDNPELLNIAVKKECREIVEIFLQHGADINASDKYGRTALHFTALSEDEEFFPNKNSDNVKGKIVSEIAREYEEFFLNKNSDVKGEIAKLLLSRGANVNAQTKNNITTLHAATYKGYVKVVEALLEHNADVNSVIESDITLHLSAQKGNEVISKMLLNKGAKENANQKDGKKTALHVATQEGHKEVVEVLLKYGAKVDSKVKSNITPLHIAVEKGYLKIVEVLLEFGNIDSRDEYGRTALHIASEKGHTKAVIALLEHGSDINITNKYNATPLDVAMTSIRSFYSRVAYNYDSDNDFNSDRGILNSEHIAEILKQHIVKIKTANSYVSKKNLLSMSSTYKIRHFQDKCEKEVAIMKSEKISNTNISFYDILTKDKNSLATYMRNENIVQVLKSDDYKTKFPIYAGMVENHFRKGMKRKELLEQGNKTFHFLFNNSPELSYHCIENIFSYLSDEDLRILIVACKPPTVSSPHTDFNEYTSKKKTIGENNRGHKKCKIQLLTNV